MSVRKELDRLFGELHAAAQADASRRESEELSNARKQVKELNKKVNGYIDRSASHAVAMAKLQLDHRHELARLKKELKTQEERARKAEAELASSEDRWDKYLHECEDLKEVLRAEEREAAKMRAECITLFEQRRKLQSGSQK